MIKMFNLNINKIFVFKWQFNENFEYIPWRHRSTVNNSVPKCRKHRNTFIYLRLQLQELRTYSLICDDVFKAFKSALLGFGSALYTQFYRANTAC